MKQLIKRTKDNDGVASIEFAILAYPLFLIILAIVEFGIVTYVNNVLEGATTFGARMGKTGFAPGGLKREEFIRSEVIRLTRGLLDPDKIEIRAQVFPTFNNISDIPPCPPPPEPCNVDYGKGGDVVLYQVTYPWRIVTPVLNKFFPNPYVIKATTPVRNEPFPGG